MHVSFNLVTSDWIPVIPVGGGALRRVSLDAALADASRLRAAAAATPLATSAAYRLLLAILQAAIAPTEDDWPDAWANPATAFQAGRHYLADWKSRFDLFDAARPFYQDAAMTGRPESVSSLLGHLASGADATLFDHTVQGGLQLSPADAALALLSVQAFGLAGTKGAGVSFVDAPCARGATLLLEGDSLAETLLLNLYAGDLSSHHLAPEARDRPTWEMDDPFAPHPARPYGLFDHLTWLNRRVQLLPEQQADGTLIVRNMRYGPGLRPGREVFNPQYHWTANTRKRAGGTDSRSHSEARFLGEKALWRDSAVLFAIQRDSGAEADKPIAALLQAQNNAMDGVLSWQRVYRLQAFGACTKSGQDKTFYYRQESLPLPLRLLSPDASDALGNLGDALARAEGAREALWRSTNQLARLILKPATPDADMTKPASTEEKKRIAGLAASWGVERQYWAELEPHFHRLVLGLADAPDAALEEWTRWVRAAAQAAFDRAVRYAGNDRRALRAVALSQATFHRGLARAIGKAGPADVATDDTEGGEADESDGE